MNRLWAPWRITYITSNHYRTKKCLFCTLRKHKKMDKKNLVFYRSTYCFAVLNLYPYNNGHVMVVPNRHIKDIELLKQEELIDLWTTVAKLKKVTTKLLKPNGYNIGINIGKDAGAGIDKHVHVHVVPRWRADTNFMPAIGTTKIISQSLHSLYAKLTRSL